MSSTLVPKNNYIANYEMLNDVEIVQNFNNLLTSFLSAAINLFVIIRLMHSRTTVHGLRRLLLVQSTVAVLSAIAGECANQVQTVGKSGYIKVGHSFLPPSYQAIRYLLSVEAFFSQLIQSIIAIFNLHRLIVVTKPHKIALLYKISIPITILCCIVTSSQYFMDGDYTNQILSTGNMSTLLIVCLICYIKLKKYFAQHASVSIRVTRLQNQLNMSMLMQMLLQAISTGLVSILPELIPALYPNANGLEDYVTMILYVILRWLSVLYPALIVWSIWGFLRESPPRSSIVIFTSADEKSRTERKHSLFA